MKERDKGNNPSYFSGDLSDKHIAMLQKCSEKDMECEGGKDRQTYKRHAKRQHKQTDKDIKKNSQMQKNSRRNA